MKKEEGEEDETSGEMPEVQRDRAGVQKRPVTFAERCDWNSPV